MCRRVLISKNIASISTRSLERNLEAASGASVSTSKMARLNRSMNSLYELLYAEFNDINKADYCVIGPQLNILLKTVKDLYTTFEHTASRTFLKKEIDELKGNYSALYEINDDIIRYRLNASSDKKLSAALKEASSLIDKL